MSIYDKYTEDMAVLVGDTIERIVKIADRYDIDRDIAFNHCGFVMKKLFEQYSVREYDLNGPRHPLTMNKEDY